MLGSEFARTMRAAQAGDEEAFVRLWRDANPAMTRYLRVVGHDDPYDGACEGWVTVVRGLPGFTGDEVAWRVWVLACARQRAEEGHLRQAWGAVTVLPGVQVDGDGELDIDELLGPEDAVDPLHRGLGDTIAALRALPLGQGEVVMLRLGAGLPVPAVADVVGVDQSNIVRAEARALERLDTDAELLAWSLGAPATPAELADEPIATRAFKGLPKPARRAGAATVIAIGPAAVLGRGERGSRSGRSVRAAERSAMATGQSARVAGRTAKAARRSRTAALTVTALTASAMSLGGLGAAAYVGALPAPIQQAMHNAIGAPAPASKDGSDAGSNRPDTPPTGAVGPNAGGSAAAGLCRAWAVDKTKGTAREQSVAFGKLASAAGGAANVDSYCTAVLAAKPTNSPSGAPTRTTTTKTPISKTPNTKVPTKTAHPAPTGRPTRTATTSQPEAPQSTARSTRKATATSDTSDATTETQVDTQPGTGKPDTGRGRKATSTGTPTQ